MTKGFISKKPTVALLIGTLALTATALTACGSDKDAPTQSGAGDAAAEITYLHRLPDGDEMTKVNEIVERWNSEHPEIHVKATKFDGVSSAMIKKLETDIAADAGPCLAQLGYSEVPEMFVKGLTQDVSQYAEKYKDNYSGAYSMMKVGDAVVGLPQDTGPLVYFYNKAQFDKLGLTVPKTMDEFVQTAAKAKESDKYIANFGGTDPYFISSMAAAAGAVWYQVKDDQWVVDVNGEKSMVAAKYWQDMLDAGSALTLGRSSEAFGKALNDQTLIGTIAPAWETPLLQDLMTGSENEGQWAVAQIPDFGAGEMTGPDGGSGVAVMKGCKYPEQAMEFNNWFNTQIDDLTTQGLVVAAKGQTKTPESVKKFYGGEDVFAVLSEANEHLAPDFSYMPYFSAISSAVAEAGSAANDGSGTVAQIYDAAQTASVQALEDAKLPVAK